MITLGNNSVVLTSSPISAGPVYHNPEWINYSSSGSSNPTIPTHQAGDLLVAVGANSNNHSGVAPVATGGWTVWDSLFESTNRAISLVYQIADAPGKTISWDTANGLRPVWVFRNAAIDKRILYTAASSTTLDWPELAAITPDSIVGAYVMSRNAQTGITAIALGGDFTQRTVRNPLPAGWIGDTHQTLIDSFNPANGTFDTLSSGHMVAAFSITGVTI